MDVLDKLNESQKQAVLATEGYIRVIAVPGSGKTKALTHRYVYLVKKLGISPSNILCVTFTNKAAREMKSRIEKMIGEIGGEYIRTFHGFCHLFLKEEIGTIKYPHNFTIQDNEDTKAILNNVYKSANLSRNIYKFNSALNDISDMKHKNEDYVLELIDSDISALRNKFLNTDDIQLKVFYGYLYF